MKHGSHAYLSARHAGVPLQLLIDHFAGHRLPERQVHQALHRFALWCAEHTPGAAPPSTGVLLSAVRAHLAGRLSDADRHQLTASFKGATIAAAVVGLKHNCTNAPSLLSAYMCLAYDGPEAARRTVYWGVIGAHLTALKEGQDPERAVRLWCERAREKLLEIVDGMAQTQ
ncbi:MAG: hypothetical protein KatS3mg015_2444 [Fimbriimonadales bacterium]|nr:MAG: hypothetical protein KatS3mg015_2444 [Fimbriimonadales bacterium]